MVSWRFLTSKIPGKKTEDNAIAPHVAAAQNPNTPWAARFPLCSSTKQGSCKHWFLVDVALKWIFPCCGNRVHWLLSAKLPEHSGSTSNSPRHAAEYETPGEPQWHLSPAQKNHLEQAVGAGCCFRWPEAQTGKCRGCDTAPQAAFHWTNLSLQRCGYRCAKAAQEPSQCPIPLRSPLEAAPLHRTHGIKPGPKTDAANASSGL